MPPAKFSAESRRAPVEGRMQRRRTGARAISEWAGRGSGCPCLGERCLKPRRESGAVGHEVAQAIAVEMVEKGIDRAAERRLERADAVHRAAPRLGGKAADEALEVLEPAYDVADDDLVGRPGQPHSAAAAPERPDEPLSLEPLGDLGVVVARNAVAARDVVARKLPVADRPGHAHARGAVAVEAQL